VTVPIDLDHTSFAVEDAVAWAGMLRREIGAVPVAGEVLAGFRYLLLYVGTAQSGARLELLQPTGDGFLRRFLDKHGAGPHHLTFTVPDLRAAVADARALGATVVGEDYSHPSWREAFLVPDQTHGVVIQVAETDIVYPSPAQLTATAGRHGWSFPSAYDASQPAWWEAAWDVARGPAATLGATRLGSTDLRRTRALFGGLLGADVTDRGDALELRWPSGTVVAHQADRPGVVGMDLEGGPAGGLRIGPALLGAHASGPWPGPTLPA
jgi:catechol 2,3-dioxygenase-like lactoylglutathione lyase family enzyme